MGMFCALIGAIYLVVCFVRVDSQQIEARLAGNEEKISKFHSLQGAWDRLGKTRRFFVSSFNYLIMAAGLLVLWQDKEITAIYWAVPLLFVVNLLCLVHIMRYANTVLDVHSNGSDEVLRLIKLQIGACIAFSLIFLILATRV